jgi:hypothetical protein
MNTATGDIQDAINQTETPYTHPTTTGWKHVPSGGSANQILRYSADGTVVWDNPDPSIAGVGDVGQNELKSVTVELIYTPIINYFSGISSTIRTLDINFKDITGFLSAEAAKEDYFESFVIAGSGDYFGIGGPGFFNNYIPDYSFAPQIKVEQDPLINYLHFQTYIGGELFGPGYMGASNPYYVDPADITSIWASYQYVGSNSSVSYQHKLRLSTYEGCRVTVKMKFITDEGDYTS